jgi:hypothetical protein
MSEWGWLKEPQEWRAIPNDGRQRVLGESPLNDRLGMIVNRGAAGKPYLVRREPLETRKKLKNAAGGYRRTYGKAGFTFEVRKLPGEDTVGSWTVWTPTDARPSVWTG